MSGTDVKDDDKDVAAKPGELIVPGRAVTRWVMTIAGGMVIVHPLPDGYMLVHKDELPPGWGE